MEIKFPFEGVSALVLSGADRETYAQWWDDALLHGALVDLLRIKVRTARVKGVDGARGPVKCLNPETGEPVSARRDEFGVLPVPGSVREGISGRFKGDGRKTERQKDGTTVDVITPSGPIKHTPKTGTCPFCPAHVRLSGTGLVTAHNRGKESVPAPRTRLVERQTAQTDMGARVGDPDAGSKRRAVDVDGAYERGAVEVPGKDACGKRVMEEVPATAENIRTALDYWKGRKPRKQASMDTQSRMISELSRRLRACEGAPAPRYDRETGQYAPTVSRGSKAMGAQMAPESSVRALTNMLPGPPLVKGRSLPPELPMFRNRKTGEMERRACGTLLGSLGRDRMDKGAMEAPAPGRQPLTRNQRRNKKRREKARAQRETQA